MVIMVLKAHVLSSSFYLTKLYICCYSKVFMYILIYAVLPVEIIGKVEGIAEHKTYQAGVKAWPWEHSCQGDHNHKQIAQVLKANSEPTSSNLKISFKALSDHYR